MPDPEVWRHFRDTIALTSASLADAQQMLKSIDPALAERVGEVSVKAQEVAESLADRLQEQQQQ